MENHKTINGDTDDGNSNLLDKRIGKMKLILGGERVCGQSYGILIFTYFLILIPSVLFFIFV